MRTQTSKSVRSITLAIISATALCIPLRTQAATVTGGTTSVALDSSTLMALTNLNFSIGAIPPATLTTMGSTTTATFPITGGDTTTMIDHSGGLAFTRAGSTADIENFVINLNIAQPNITGELASGGVVINGITLFNIGAGSSLTLAQPFASEISMVFGTPDLTGTPIGTATVDAITASTPEPSTFGFALLGLAPAAYLIARRGRNSPVPAPAK